MTKPKTTQKTKAIDRKRINEALLADRLGINEEWIERWEERGKIREEFHMPDRLPTFICRSYKKEIKDIEGAVERLVTLGCQRRVIYFCLAQLSPEATRLRAGLEREPVFGIAPKDVVMDADYFTSETRPLAAREDLKELANTAKAARKKIHRYQRELFLVAESSNYPLPVGFVCQPKTATEALMLLQDSLTWAAELAGTYTAPMETTLLKSKGLLYLTLYVSMYADSKKLRGSRIDSLHRDSSKPSDSVRARGTHVAGEPLTNLAVMLAGKHNASEEVEGKDDKGHKNDVAWSTSDLHRKLANFREDHPKLYKKLVAKLKELHNFTSR